MVPLEIRACVLPFLRDLATRGSRVAQPSTFNIPYSDLPHWADIKQAFSSQGTYEYEVDSPYMCMLGCLACSFVTQPGACE
jgi:predicted aconitase